MGGTGLPFQSYCFQFPVPFHIVLKENRILRQKQREVLRNVNLMPSSQFFPYQGLELAKSHRHQAGVEGQVPEPRIVADNDEFPAFFPAPVSQQVIHVAGKPAET